MKWGEVLRAKLWPIADPRAKPGTLGALATPPFDAATAYGLLSEDSETKGGMIFADDFEIGFEPQDQEWVRRNFPHIFSA